MRCNSRGSEWNVKQNGAGGVIAKSLFFASLSTGFILNNFVLLRGEPAGSNHGHN